jgi:hypothetical protein
VERGKGKVEREKWKGKSGKGKMEREKWKGKNGKGKMEREKWKDGDTDEHVLVGTFEVDAIHLHDTVAHERDAVQRIQIAHDLAVVHVDEISFRYQRGKYFGGVNIIK